MRIERGQHAVDGVFDELLLIGLLDIVGAHLVEHVAKQAEILVGVGGSGLSRSADDGARLLAKRGASRSNCDSCGDKGCFANHPPTFRLSDFAHHGPEFD